MQLSRFLCRLKKKYYNNFSCNSVGVRFLCCRKKIISLFQTFSRFRTFIVCYGVNFNDHNFYAVFETGHKISINYVPCHEPSMIGVFHVASSRHQITLNNMAPLKDFSLYSNTYSTINVCRPTRRSIVLSIKYRSCEWMRRCLLAQIFPAAFEPWRIRRWTWFSFVIYMRNHRAIILILSGIFELPHGGAFKCYSKLKCIALISQQWFHRKSWRARARLLLCTDPYAKSLNSDDGWGWKCYLRLVARRHFISHQK